jgi:acyl-CoA thioester hydrolase
MQMANLHTRDLLSGFPVIIEQTVAWGEMDGFGHVNNVVYFRYFENARIEYMRLIDWFKFQRDTGIGPILASTQARYRRAVTYPDTLLVGARVSVMAEDRLTMDYRIASTKLADIVTLGDSLVVTYHYPEQKKVPVPGELRLRIEKLEGRHFG